MYIDIYLHIFIRQHYIHRYTCTEPDGTQQYIASNGCQLNQAGRRVDHTLHTCFSNLHVVLMDEGHHLTRPHPFYSDQLRTLHDLPNLHVYIYMSYQQQEQQQLATTKVISIVM